MIVLDTSILLYAKGSEHPFREPCREMVAAIGDRRVTATTTVEVIQEFAHVRARRRGREDAIRFAREYADLLSPLLVAEEKDLRRGLTLYERHQELGAFDAVLAAVALSVGAEALVSGDAGFSEVPRLKHVAPGTPEFDALLSS